MKKLRFIVLIMSAALVACNNQTEITEDIIDDIAVDEIIDEVEPVEEIGVEDLVEINNDFTDFKNDEHKVGFKYPASWTIDEQAMPEMYFFEAVDKELGVNFNITVGSDQDAKLSDWELMIKGELKNNGSEILSTSTIKVSGIDCFFSNVKRKNETDYIIQNSYVLLKNGHAYMMNFTCAEIIYDASKDIEDYIISTVNID